MGDKKKAKEIVRTIKKTKKRVAGRLDKKIEKNQRLFSILVPFFAGLLFFIFAILNLRSSVWFEESYAKYATQGNFGDIFSVTTTDARSPLFYFILKMWSSIFGTSDIALRFMSIFFGFVAIVFIFQLVKKWFGIKAASMATVLVSISPMLIRFGQEIGAYTLLIAMLVIATYAFSLAVEKGAKGRMFWAFYVITMAFSLWLKYLAVIVFIPQIIYTIIHFGGFKKIYKNKKLFKTLLVSFISVIVLFIPWIVIMILRAGTVVRGGENVSLGKFFDFVFSTLFYNDGSNVTGWGVVFGIAFIVSIVVASVMTYQKASIKNKEKLCFVLSMVIVPLVLLTIFSLPPLRGVFRIKELLFSSVTVWVFFGIIFTLMKDSCLKNILMILVLIVAGIGIYNVEKREPKGDISEILAETFIAAEEGEPILVKGAERFYDGVFYTSDKHPIYIFEDEIGAVDSSVEAIGYYKTNLIEDKEAFLKEHENVWYIIETPSAGLKYEIPEWASKMRIVSEISFDHHTALEFTK